MYGRYGAPALELGRAIALLSLHGGTRDDSSRCPPLWRRLHVSRGSFSIVNIPGRIGAELAVAVKELALCGGGTC